MCGVSTINTDGLPMKIKQFVVCLLFLLGGMGVGVFAQDVIILKTGDEVKAVVSEIGLDVVKYKKAENLNGPLYTLEKAKIFMIKYENGTKDVFTESTAPKTQVRETPVQTQQPVAQPQPQPQPQPILAPSNPTVTDVDGNVYNTVNIGSQVWMVENLRTTRYRNGDPILVAADNWSSQKTGALCYYNNIPQDVATYGCIYNWWAVTDQRKVAPEGWEVATDADWQTLIDYLGGENVAGGKLKEVGTAHWSGPNKAATNESGFTALPAGGRYDNGKFAMKGLFGLWVALPDKNPNLVWGRILDWNSGKVMNMRDGGSKNGGGSVRCIKRL